MTEYLTVHVMPEADGGWRAEWYAKSSYPALRGGHPRTLRTFPAESLPGLRGLSLGAVSGVLRLAFRGLGTLPMCARCGDALDFGEDEL